MLWILVALLALAAYFFVFGMSALAWSCVGLFLFMLGVLVGGHNPRQAQEADQQYKEQVSWLKEWWRRWRSR